MLNKQVGIEKPGLSLHCLSLNMGGQEEDSLKTALLFSVYCLHILHLGGGKLRLGPRSSL